METLAILKAQLGREPRGVQKVNIVCQYGFPQVITTRPIFTVGTEVEVFPTMYWLTCPYLRKEVAVLEGAGMIAFFEQKVRDDADFRDMMSQNHSDYARRRLALIPSCVQKKLEQEYPQRYKVLAQTGVGGIRAAEGVKCLHAHLADYLVHGENVIGEMVVRLLNKPLFCPEGRCGSLVQGE